MSTLDDYISRAARMLRRDATGLQTRESVDQLCREIQNVFETGYIPAEMYSTLNSSQPFFYSEIDLTRILSILRDKRDELDRQLYGEYGLATVTEHIRLLERAADDGIDSDDLVTLYKRVDSIYANHPDSHSYIDGLSGYFGDYRPCDEQTILRIEKLKLFRDEQIRRLKATESQSTSFNMVQSSNQNTSASMTNNVQISIETTFQQIDDIPDETLSDEEKTMLKGMIGDLNTNDKAKRDGKLSKLLTWLGTRGVDVFIAAMPYIVQLIQSHP